MTSLKFDVLFCFGPFHVEGTKFMLEGQAFALLQKNERLGAKATSKSFVDLI